ncbi:MAG: type 4a pilus biogenesis protein PilO [Terriglobia bacterium]
MNWLYVRRRWLFWLLATLVVADLGLYFGWVRNPGVLQEADPAQVARLEQAVAARAAEVKRLSQVRDQAPRLRPQLEEFTQRFWDQRTGYSRVLGDLENAASKVGVSLSRSNYEEKTAEEWPILVQVEITSNVEGSFGNVLRYLDELERLPGLYLINELAVIGSRGGRIRLEMRLATYFRRASA